ncbi:MAG: Penicillin-binding protein 2D [Syntrophorhabdaceae bacterium PtaU1.Bin034]|jgi:penicillin-binding protein 1C|nr:MAG: Penicillin-binding protein 2D [Syntrophorhabdaceae bacterium PtaU1.Bin034]
MRRAIVDRVLIGLCLALLVFDGILVLDRVLSKGTPPAFEAVRARYGLTETVSVANRGSVLEKIKTSANKTNWVELREISPILVKTIVAAEDIRFWRHSGIDLLALLHAGVLGAVGKSDRDGNTVTMQLADTLEESAEKGRVSKNFRKKWEQICSARAIERRWTKEEILEAYLNLTVFHGYLRGVGAASARVFHKSCSRLDENESLLLAALIRSPFSSAETVAQKAVRLKHRMKLTGDDDIINRLADETLNRM